jgi:hypothetical protein
MTKFFVTYLLVYRTCNKVFDVSYELWGMLPTDIYMEVLCTSKCWYSSLHYFWPLTLLGEPSMWTTEWRKEEGRKQLSLPPSLPFLHFPSSKLLVSDLLQGSNRTFQWPKTLTPPITTYKTRFLCTVGNHPQDYMVSQLKRPQLTSS